MQSLLSAGALSLVIVSLLAALLVSGQKDVRSLDMTLTAEQVWARSQEAQRQLRTFKMVQTFAFDFENTGPVSGRSVVWVDRNVGLVRSTEWLTTLSDPFEGSALAELQRQLGMSQGEAFEGVELVYLRPLPLLQWPSQIGDRVFGRKGDVPWIELNRNLAPHLRQYLALPDSQPMPPFMELLSPTVVDGQLVYRLRQVSPQSRRELLIDADFRVIRETRITQNTGASNPGFSRDVLTYSYLGTSVPYPDGLPR